MTEKDNAPHLLIVDDVAQNIQILATMLSVDHYRISFAQRGNTALQLLQQEHFDLILLDVQMPEMNGFEVCKAIKSHPHLANIPIVFLTAYAGSEQSVLGFKLGAVDYITKPVEPMELRARVRTHLALKTARDQVMAQNKNLERLNHEKSQLLRFVSHDLRTPLTIMSSGLDYLDEHLKPTPVDKVQRRLLNMRVAIGRMGSIIEHFLNREVIQKGQQNISLTHFSLANFLQELQLHHEAAAEEKQMRLKIDRKEWTLYTDKIALQQILDNLLSNALKYAPENTEVTLSVIRQNGACIFCVADQGKGFDSSWLQEQKLDSKQKKALGLRIVQKMVDLLGGCLIINSNSETGTEIEISIPMEVPL